MAVTPYNFVIDITKKRLLDAVGSLNTADSPKFFRGDTAAITVRMVEPSGSFDTPTPTKPFPAGSSIIVAIGVPGQSADASTTIAAVLTPEEVRNGTLLIDTVGLRALLGDKASQAGTLEFRLIEADDTKTILAQVDCTIFNVVTVPSATAVQESTTAGLAIELCESAAALANTAAIAATDAATGANTAKDAANTAAAGANSAATAANDAAANVASVLAGISWTGDQLVVNGITGPHLTGPMGTLAGANGFIQITASRDLAPTDNGCVLYSTSGTGFTLTLPSTLGSFMCVVLQQSTGQITFAAGAGATVTNEWTYTKTRTTGSVAQILATAPGVGTTSGSMA